MNNNCERSSDARASVSKYGVRVMLGPPPASTAANHQLPQVGNRYDDMSLHSVPRQGESCSGCMTRIPYATLVATVMCLVGVGIFCGTMYRGATLSVLMFDQVFHLRVAWMEAVQLVFTTVGACMGALGLMILFVGCLATGATRNKVYRTWTVRVGGRISCAVFMGISYILQIAWVLMLCFLVIITLLTTIFWFMCSSSRITQEQQCIDLRQFDFMFPFGTRHEDLEICEPHEIKLFCKDFIEKAEVMFILATVACFLVTLSLVHYLICLSANYAHIRSQSKFQELQELQYLSNDMELLHNSKDRF